MRTRPQNFDEIIDTLGCLACSLAARKDRRGLERLVFLLKNAYVASLSTPILKMIAIVCILILVGFADVADRAFAVFTRLAACDSNETARPEPPLIRIPNIKQNAPNIYA